MRYTSMLILLFCPLPLLAGEKAPLKKGNLYFVAIGQQDDWKFLPGGFARAMRDQGKELYREIHGTVLVGPKATKKDLLDSIDLMCEKATADDLVIIFIACHGNCVGGPKGESVFETRKGIVRPREIKSRLAKLPCQAVFINDACQSGNWPKEFPPEDVMPPNVTALCCCLSTQVSDIQFDITLFEALHGKADFNKDGIVDLDEVIKYCELRIREVEGGTLTPVLHKAKNLKHALPLTKANSKLISVIHKREVFTAVVEKEDGDNYEVHVLGFDKPGSGAGLGGSRLPSKYSRADVILPKDGAPLMAVKGGLWQPACLLGKEGADYKIRYAGTNEQAVLKSEHVRHLFAGDPNEKISRGLFKKKVRVASAEQGKKLPAKIHEVGMGLTIDSKLEENDDSDEQRQSLCKVFLVQMEKGNTYQIDMVSKQFDAYLRLEDAKKKQLAEDDDSGGGLNARIVFTPSEDGVYRVIATSYREDVVGTFQLRIKQR
jgi:hypothetical protein